jgi:hypothetical protein
LDFEMFLHDANPDSPGLRGRVNELMTILALTIALGLTLASCLLLWMTLLMPRTWADFIEWENSWWVSKGVVAREMGDEARGNGNWGNTQDRCRSDNCRGPYGFNLLAINSHCNRSRMEPSNSSEDRSCSKQPCFIRFFWILLFQLKRSK